MKLHFQNYSTSGEPLFILHGLFGSLSNWNWHSKQFSEHFSVYGVDLRNHGESPHDDTLNYDVMAQDVVQLFDDLGVKSASVIGHSMGGKVAMELALRWPDYINKLIVVDIAPVSYPDRGDGHLDVIEGMKALELSTVESRREAESRLEGYIADQVTRKFILTNLVSGKSDGFRWRINLQSIEHNYAALRNKPSGSGVFRKPVLFLKGALSNYIKKDYQLETLKLFPNARVKSIMGAGHWLHAEKPQVFQKIAKDFLT
tara:strand:- start:229 stop:1002 length:774 start_codon:yes stop_codon:yes gene_type:complete